MYLLSCKKNTAVRATSKQKYEEFFVLSKSIKVFCQTKDARWTSRVLHMFANKSFLNKKAALAKCCQHFTVICLFMSLFFPSVRSSCNCCLKQSFRSAFFSLLVVLFQATKNVCGNECRRHCLKESRQFANKSFFYSLKAPEKIGED